MIMNASVWVTFGGAPAKDTGFILRCPVGNWGNGDPFLMAENTWVTGVITPRSESNLGGELRWWFQMRIFFTPIHGKMIQCGHEHYFSNGLVQPLASSLIFWKTNQLFWRESYTIYNKTFGITIGFIGIFFLMDTDFPLVGITGQNLTCG